MKYIWRYFTLIMCILWMITLSIGVTGYTHSETDVTIWEGYDESERLYGLNKNEKIDISVTVTSPPGGTVDVYLLSQDEYMYGYPDEPFNPALYREDVASTSFTFTCPDDQSYYLVIDNLDNSRTTDTVPIGDVTVDYEYDDPILEEMEAAFWTAWWTAWYVCIGLVIIGIVVIILIIFVIIKMTQKDKPPQYPPQYPQTPPQGYQQYPQQPYQQPYPPPPQQPPPQPPQQPPPG